MLRQEVSEKEFKVELEKMTVKEKFNTLNQGEDVDSTKNLSQSDSLTEEADKAKEGWLQVRKKQALFWAIRYFGNVD